MTKRQHITVSLVLTCLAGCAGASSGRSTPIQADSAGAHAAEKASLSDRVVALIVRETGAPQERVIPQARFAEDLGLDELDMIELVMALEEEFGIEFTDEAFDRMRTVADVIEYVRTHAGERR